MWAVRRSRVVRFSAKVFLSISLFLFSASIVSNNISDSKPETFLESRLQQNATDKARTSLLNLTNFRYILNPTCLNRSSSIEIIVLVTSNAINFNLRAAQRNAFDSRTLEKSFGIKRFFILAADKKVSQRKITNEHHLHGDLVQGNFAESYQMLSFKHIMGLQWATQQCYFNHKRLMILKMDDDILVDYHQLLQKIKTYSEEDLRQKLFGLQHFQMEINRQGKWAVSRQELFEQETYPNFLSGWAYVISMESASQIVKAASEETEIFWIDDVWITGFLAQKVGLELESLNPYYTVYTEHMSCCSSDPNFFCDFWVGPSNGVVQLIREFGKQVLKCKERTPTCQRRKFKNSIIQNCPVKNPLFLPETKAVGEVFS